MKLFGFQLFYFQDIRCLFVYVFFWLTFVRAQCISWGSSPLKPRLILLNWNCILVFRCHLKTRLRDLDPHSICIFSVFCERARAWDRPRDQLSRRSRRLLQVRHVSPQGLGSSGQRTYRSLPRQAMCWGRWFGKISKTLLYGYDVKINFILKATDSFWRKCKFLSKSFVFYEN